jgi:hypothetical protein
MKPSLHLTLFEALSYAVIDAPAGDDHPAADRWRWFADLYGNRTWGLVSTVEGFPRMAADQIATACRDTAAQRATIEQWQAIKEVATAGRAAAPSQSVDLAWSAVLDTCGDAFDHLAGRRFGGLEAILGSIEAVLHEHDVPIARTFVNDAYSTWERQLTSHDSYAESVA